MTEHQHRQADHVALLVEYDAGQPIKEVVPALQRDDGLWEIRGTPALAEGCATGDVVAIDETGAFEVRVRGGNLAIVSYAPGGQHPASDMTQLRELFDGCDALVESPPDHRWIVLTVPVAIGFAAVEARMARWQASTGSGWSYGNVYDAQDEPLNWWLDA